MLKAEIGEVRQFIQKKATDKDVCKKIELYDYEVQQMLQKVYEALWRLNLYDSQMIYVFNEALSPFKIGGK